MTPTNKVVETFNGYDIALCPCCTLVFSNPMFDTSKMYADEYAQASDKAMYAYSSWLKNVRAIHRSCAAERLFFSSTYKGILDVVQCLVRKNDAVLDMGCGHGLLMKRMKKMGIQTYGCEVSDRIVQCLQELGYCVYNSTKDAYKKEWLSPKVVVLSEVLEHVGNPVEFLKDIRNKFTSSILLLTVPHPRRIHLAVGREYQDYPPHHFTRWNAKSLQSALQKAGYDRIDIHEYPIYWREALYGLVVKMISFVNFRQNNNEDKTRKDAFKLEHSDVKNQIFKFFYPLLWLISQPFIPYFTAKGIKGQSMIAVAFPANESNSH
jgi:SAM-dependent methyltransferase